MVFGYLNVSFFRPCYCSYIVFKLVTNYQHAFVSSPNKSYLWLLSRTRTPSKEVIKDFIEKATALGFGLNEIIFPKHDTI